MGGGLRAVLVALSLVACERIGGGGRDAGAEAGAALEGGDRALTCADFDEPVAAGAVTTTALTEASGLVASRRQPGVFFAHNDSGDGPLLYALGDDGRLLATFEVDGAKHDDWEDLGLLPGAAGDALYIADVGDNSLSRSEVVLYRVPEPTVAAGSGRTAPARATRLVYPAGQRHNVETLLVDPASGDVLLVARAPGGRAPLFRAAAAALDAETVPLEAAGYLTLPGEDTARGGAVALSREAVALRTTRGLLLYALPPGATLLQGLEGAPCALPVGPEVQGEAVTFGPGGDYFTLGEGTRPTLYRARRKGAP